MRLNGSTISQSSLTAEQREQMLALMQRHYCGVDRALFLADLAEKDWVIVVHDREGILRGFSTQTILQADVDGRQVRALFSGDTVVDRDCWGDTALSHHWGQLALQLIDRFGDDELYWFLISQGFRTYRFLPVFFQEFFPRFDGDMPDKVARVLDVLASQRFGSAYDRERRVIGAGPQQYRLRDSLAEVPSSRMQDPHVRHFLAANPEFARGEELCCLAPLTRENFTAAAWRVIECGQPAVELR